MNKKKKAKRNEFGQSLANIQQGINDFNSNPNNAVRARHDELFENNLLFVQKVQTCCTTTGIPMRKTTTFSTVTNTNWTVIQLKSAQVLAEKNFGLTDTFNTEGKQKRAAYSVLLWQFVSEYNFLSINHPLGDGTKGHPPYDAGHVYAMCHPNENITSINKKKRHDLSRVR